MSIMAMQDMSRLKRYYTLVIDYEVIIAVLQK